MKKTIAAILVALNLTAVLVAQADIVVTSVHDKGVDIEIFMGPTLPPGWVYVNGYQPRVNASPAQLYLWNPTTRQTAVWLIRQH